MNKSKDLPVNYFWDDKEFITKQLELIPISMREKVRKKYSHIWLKLQQEDPKNHQFRVNTWLRKVTEKYKIKKQEGYF